MMCAIEVRHGLRVNAGIIYSGSLGEGKTLAPQSTRNVGYSMSIETDRLKQRHVIQDHVRTSQPD
jgi:hypothetical protein